MRMWEKKALVCAAGAAAAVAGSTVSRRAGGTEVIQFDPAEITGTVSFGAEVLTEYQVLPSPSGAPLFWAPAETFTTSSYSVTVENKRDYALSLLAYLENGLADFTHISVYRTNYVHVDEGLGPTVVNFNYPTAGINFNVDVTGGTIQQYIVSASSSGGGESRRGETYKTFPSDRPSAAGGRVIAIADDNVRVNASALVTTPDETSLLLRLGEEWVDLSQGDVDRSWSAALTNVGTLFGDLAVSTDANVVGHQIDVFSAVGSAANFVHGYKKVVGNGPYTLTLPAGTYNVRLSTMFDDPGASSVAKVVRVTVNPGEALRHDLVETTATGVVPLAVGGFAPDASLQYVYVQVSRQDLGSFMTTHVSAMGPNDGEFEFPLYAGPWRLAGVGLGFFDDANATLPLDEEFVRYRSSAELAVEPGSTVDFGLQEVTLVASNAYFDVLEAPPGAPEVLISDPNVELSRYVPDAGGGPGTFERIWARGSSEPRGTSGLTLLAAPGTYTMNTTATIGGNVVQLGARQITFPEPVATGAGAGVEVKPLASQDLAVGVTFPQVTAGGLTTVVETPFGPEPPEGLKAFCADGASAEGVDCGGPIYYDIKTTADYPKGAGDAPVKVCIRRKFQADNGIANFLRLWHYNEALATPDKWELLPPPPGQEPAVDCAADLSACGCPDEASCGIDYLADPPVSVVMVCGMTKSFSPFAIFEHGIVKFTNEVNGVAYEGPTGPPSLQSWTAPAEGVYRITATGARGASASLAQSIAGGCGAQIAGDFVLHGGDTVQMLVGQKGTSAPYSGGGGGGTFVVLNGAPLVVAGGGGGVRQGALVNGRNGKVGTAGGNGSVSASYTSGFVAGGVDGLGGSRAAGYGSAGGGWFGNGASDGNYGEGGLSFLGTQAGRGGFGKACGGLAHGGYGGGGAGNGCYGGGGGGGYSGGGAGRVGGGGGSWNAGANPAGHEGVCTSNGHGMVQIERVGP